MPSTSEATLILNDRYAVERELGRGGMSVVYLARDRQLLAKRSCRVLLEETSVDPWIRQKFQQEMEALARIDDPGVVGVLDTGLTAVHLSQWSPYLTNLGECTVKHGVKVHLSI